MTLQRPEEVALRAQHVAQPLDVGGGELAVPGRGAGGRDQPLGLEEAHLGDRDVGELLGQRPHHRTHREAARRRSVDTVRGQAWLA